jgi:hypothetical protein
VTTPGKSPGTAKNGANATTAQERFIDPLKITAAVAAALGSTIIGSLLGDSGTRIGLIIGTVASSLIVASVERSGRKAAALAKGRITVKHLDQFMNGRIILVAGAITLAGLVGVTAGVEAATGKTLHGVVTNTADYGSSFANSSHTPPHPNPKITLTPSPSVSSSAISSPSVSPSDTSSAIFTPTSGVSADDSSSDTSPASPSSTFTSQAPIPEGS